jgi:hypothetical protein
MRRAAPLAGLLIALAAAGCGAKPPQAPLPEARELDYTTGQISSACGEAYQVTAFPGDRRRDLLTLEATAASSARKLGAVYRRNPRWIYQGQTVAAIVSKAVALLHECGLARAAAPLEDAQRGH